MFVRVGPFFRELWWPLLFSVVVCYAYFQSVREKQAAIQELTVRLGEMEKEKIVAFAEKEDLQLRIASQNDPAWIEMILMRDLGVVPEGFLKVHFRKS